MGCKQCKISKIDKEINLDDIEKIIVIQKIFRKFLIKKKIKECLKKIVNAFLSVNILSTITIEYLMTKINKKILNYISKKYLIDVETIKFIDFYRLYLGFLNLNCKIKLDFSINFLLDPFIIQLENNEKEIYWGQICISLIKN